MYGAGLRLQETLDLYPKDIDLDQCSIRVRSGKGGKARVVGLDPAACRFLVAWMDRGDRLGLTGRHPVFATYSANSFGRPLRQRYVRTALARAADRAGATKRIHPHGLRHSHAFALANEGKPMYAIQALLGHFSVGTTDRYIRHLAGTEVVEMMRDRPDWMAG